jgi:hypothetical protein
MVRVFECQVVGPLSNRELGQASALYSTSCVLLICSLRRMDDLQLHETKFDHVDISGWPSS